jgi:hypothetical protein
MEGNTINSPLHKRQGQVNHFKTQFEAFCQYLDYHLATASMASKVLNIPQKNLCWYKRQLEKAGKLWAIELKPCKVTGYKAHYLTTNKDLATSVKNLSNQLALFE